MSNGIGRSVSNGMNATGSALSECFASVSENSMDAVKSLAIGTLLGTAFSGVLAVGLVTGVTAALASLIHSFTLPLFQELFNHENENVRLLVNVAHVVLSAVFAHSIISATNPPYRIDLMVSVAQVAVVMLFNEVLDHYDNLGDVFKR